MRAAQKSRANHLGAARPLSNSVYGLVQGCYTSDVKGSGQFVILGAGNLGRRVNRALNAVLFCDNNSRLWGTLVEGVTVESPAVAVSRFPDATFVVAIWNPSRSETMLDRMGQLKSLGASRVIPFTQLFDEYGEQLLPHLLWAKRDYYASQKEEWAEGRALLDEAGRAEFDRQMQLRSGDFRGQVIDQSPQYFPSLIELSGSEVFIDCGAYDGDTVAEFRKATGNRFEQIVAFEPDPINLALLEKATHGDNRVSIRPFGVGARKETLRFAAAGTGSHISENGGCEVQIVTLDDALRDLAPTYIKFDIEGSEMDALEGGMGTIMRHRPKLAVCVYHCPDHLWRIPLKLHELLPDSNLTLRTYNADGFECVCYCVPN